MGKNKKCENKEAIEKLKETFGGNNKLDLPGNIKFEFEENSTQCRMKLEVQKVVKENMQNDAQAFEGWAIAMHIALDKQGTIILDVDEKIDDIPYVCNGHWSRFLYRALRFSEQYGEWFRLSEKVETQVKKFKEYLENNRFTNNIPKNEAGNKGKTGSENYMEIALAENNELKDVVGSFIGENEVNRQLKVGLFLVEDNFTDKKKYETNDKNKIFTGRGSAIDLWTWNEDKLYVVELKANKNKKMGIITEIFFYSNYMYDFLVRDWDSFVLNGPSGDRGYNNILEHKDDFKEVCGIMLADKFHPIIENDEVLKVLNDIRDGVNIKYAKLGYNYEVKINDIE
ncbi:MAG: hypothetical protein ACTTG8_06550 [Catonella sp.]|uniref:hypothetical protein n=1 Tax=Catonella sp. TaxID=2382125 RepID=UPI003F9F71B2